MDAAPNTQHKYIKPLLHSKGIEERAKKLKTAEDFKDDLEEKYDYTWIPSAGASTRYNELDSLGAVLSKWFVKATHQALVVAHNAAYYDDGSSKGNPQLEQARAIAQMDYDKAFKASKNFVVEARKYDAHLREEKKRKRLESAAAETRAAAERRLVPRTAFSLPDGDTAEIWAKRSKKLADIQREADAIEKVTLVIKEEEKKQNERKAVLASRKRKYGRMINKLNNDDSDSDNESEVEEAD